MHQDYYFAPSVYSIIAHGQWDIVHCQCYHTLLAPLAMFAAWRAQIPYVVSFHSGGHSSVLRNALRGPQIALLRPLFARAQKLIAVSNFEAASFREQIGVPAERIVVIPNGASMPKVTLPPQQQATSPMILSVGRLERYKGHHRVIAALPLILQQRPGVRLKIIGSGPYKAELQALVRRLQLTDHVEIFATPPGNRQYMAELLAGAALVTLLSEYEAHPIAVMEALALRRSILVANTSGLSELAEQGLVRAIPLNSTPAQVAQAVLNQLRDPLTPPAIELPTWEGCTNALLKLYHASQQQRPDPCPGAPLLSKI
jgi:glycosyltransferase involved in cell wall biosynthesis